jgi:hypothetical protein
MKKITTSLLFFLFGFLGLANQTKAQTSAIPVPTYQNRSEIPNRITPEQKQLRQLPMVVLTENGLNISEFKTEITKWIEKNPSTVKNLEKSYVEMINQKQFENLADALIEIGHYKQIQSAVTKGGKHE